MPIIERDVALQGVDKDGNPTIDMPITRLGNIEDTAEIKETLADKDYIPVIDSENDGEIKKVEVAVLKQHLAATDKQDTLTGAPGQIVGFDGDGQAAPLTLTAGDNITLKQEGGTLEIGAVAPGKNLLINWYFRKPVNRKNIKNVSPNTTKTYFIDRWTTARGYIEVTTNGLSILCDSEMNNCFVQQIVLLPELSGKQATVSALIDGELYAYTVIFPTENLKRISSIVTDGIQFSITKLTASFSVDIYAMPSSTPRFAVAAKLELGPVQTLARQNEDGEWEVIDPPDYDLQYLLCSQYSPSTGEWVGVQHSNPNLLDNWYFLDPINQRGNAIYLNGGYGIDRWYISQRGYGTSLTVDETGILFEVKSNSGTNANGEFIYQAYENLKAGTYTFSVLVSQANGSAILGVDRNAAPWGTLSASVPLKVGLNTVTFTITNDENKVGIFLVKGVKDIVSFKFVAAKFEPGPVQTLARQNEDGEWELIDPPPNKAVEMQKCQRYLCKLASNSLFSGSMGATSTDVSFFVPLPTPLRANPANFTINVGLRVGSGAHNVTFTSSRFVLSGNGVTVIGTIDKAAGGAYSNCQVGLLGDVYLDANL